MTATAAVPSPNRESPIADATDPMLVQIPPADLPTLLDQAAVPAHLRDRIGDRIQQGDLTWTAGRDGLIVWVPPSRATTARTTKHVKSYRVGATSCTCRGAFTTHGCYHPWLWAVIHAALHPPVFTVSGSAALTLEQPLLVAALHLMEQHAASEVTIWLGGETLSLEWTTAADTPAQLSLLGTGAVDSEASARGSIAALAALIATCPSEAFVVTLVATPSGLTWSTEAST